MNEVEGEKSQSVYNNFTSWLKLSGFSKNTRKQYLIYLNCWLKMGVNINNITPQDIERFCERFKHQNARSFLKNFLHEFQDLPFLKIPKIKGMPQKLLPKWIGKTEVDRLVRGITIPEHQLLVKILFETGARISEALAITPLHIFGNEIKLFGKEKKERMVYITQKTLKQINQYIKEKNIAINERIFPYCRTKAFMLIKKYGYEILGKKIHPHMLRHSIAVYLLKQGMSLLELQKFLGHENVGTTEIYTHITGKEVKTKWLGIMEKEKEEIKVSEPALVSSPHASSQPSSEAPLEFP